MVVCVQVALQEGLENIQNFFQRNSCRLPLSPSLVAKELNIKVIHVPDLPLLVTHALGHGLLPSSLRESLGQKVASLLVCSLDKSGIMTSIDI